MIYFLYWYMVVIALVSIPVGFYVVAKNNNKTTTQKVAMLLGQTTRSVATGVFFVWIYPVLKFVS